MSLEKKSSQRGDLQTSFIGAEAARFRESLASVVPHIKPGKLALAGSSALRHHLALKGITHPTPTFNDLDLWIQQPSDISSSMREENRLLFTHFHPPAEYPHMISNFFIKVLDKQTRTKIDFFSYPAFAKTESVLFEGYELRVPTPETLLIVSVLDTMKSLESFGGAPEKRISTIDLTMQVANIDDAARIWKEYFPNEQALLIVIDQIKQTFITSPDIFVGKMLKHKPVANCDECVNTDEFPLAPADDVREILGIRRRGNTATQTATT